LHLTLLQPAGTGSIFFSVVFFKRSPKLSERPVSQDRDDGCLTDIWAAVNRHAITSTSLLCHRNSGTGRSKSSGVWGQTRWRIHLNARYLWSCWVNCGS